MKHLFAHWGRDDRDNLFLLAFLNVSFIIIIVKLDTGVSCLVSLAIVKVT